jgi:hypothetical protein
MLTIYSRLNVAGHSLGGALASLFAFYAATDERLRADKHPVEVFSFASPPVGDNRFRKAFKRLERDGRLQYARIANDHDLGASHKICVGVVVLCMFSDLPFTDLM